MTPEAKKKRYLRKKQLAERYSTHTRSIDRMVKDGRLPKPSIFMGSLPLWDEAEIEANEAAAVRGR